MTDPDLLNLHRSVALAPDDGGARMAFMDRLEEVSELERLEFMRVSGELTELESGVRRQVLLKAHDREWRGVRRCVECEGRGHEDSQNTRDDCLVCRGTGFACWPLVEVSNENPGTAGIWDYIIHCTWERGWIAGITTTVANFLRPDVAGTIATWWPLERVTLSNAEELTGEQMGIIGHDPFVSVLGGQVGYLRYLTDNLVRYARAEATRMRACHD